MSATVLETARLRLVGRTRQESMDVIAALSPSDKTQLSAEWLKLLYESRETDPWIHGFVMVHRETGLPVGQCGFKGGPGADGVVEIAYGVEQEHEGRGYATESAAALVQFAFDSRQVRLVRAHTLPLPQGIASGRVLTKCGFQYVGDFVDPEDGVVRRFERTQRPS